MMESWLNKSMKIQMTDGRTLVGIFLCTDKDKNVILGSCQEFLTSPEGDNGEEPRTLGLAMVPGHHIVSIHIDVQPDNQQSHTEAQSNATSLTEALEVS